MKTDYNKLKKEFLDYLKKERGFSDYTVKSYNIDIKIFFEFCKKKTNQLVFADLSDSASFIISDALEISDKYFKNQVLKKKKVI